MPRHARHSPCRAVFTDQQVAAQRYYAASAVSRRGRRGAWSAVRGVPVAHASGAPSASVPTYDASAITVAWTPATDARLAPSPTGDGLLESRALGPHLPATKYNVYGAENAVASETPAGTVVRPVPLNAAPLESLHYDAAGVTFGRERCFVVAWSGRRQRRQHRGPALGSRVRHAGGHVSTAATSGPRGRWRSWCHQPDLGRRRRPRSRRLPRLSRANAGRRHDAAHAGAHPRCQLRGPHGYAWRALRVRRRRDRLGEVRQQKRAVESRGRDGEAVTTRGWGSGVPRHAVGPVRPE